MSWVRIGDSFEIVGKVRSDSSRRSRGDATVALDIYVGPLTRFYTGNWKPVLTQLVEGPDPDCAASGRIVSRVADFQEKSPAGPVPVEVKVNRNYPNLFAWERLDAWRQEVNEALSNRLDQPVSWAENSSGVYFTDKPGWDPYQALLLWAAHEEHPELELPSVVPQEAGVSSALDVSFDESAPSRYPTLLRSDVWLPGDHPFVFECQNPLGAEISLGFTGSLLSDLRTLNARTWKASERKVAQWFRKATRPGDRLKTSAKFAFAVFYLLTQKAVEHDLPMILDW